MEELSQCGYAVSWRVVSAKEWLPQQRERVYLVGFRRDLGIEMRWDGVRGGKPSSALRDVLESPRSEAAAACELSEAQWQQLRGQLASFKRWPGAPPCSLSDRAVDLCAKAPTLTSSYRHVSNYTSRYVCEELDGSLRDGGQRRPRFLSPRECARLMGFPDSFAVPPAHDTHATAHFYRQIGNAVCPPVVESVAAEMLRLLEAERGGVGGQGWRAPAAAVEGVAPPAIVREGGGTSACSLCVRGGE